MDFKTQLSEFKQKYGFRTNKEGIDYFSNLFYSSPINLEQLTILKRMKLLVWIQMMSNANLQVTKTQM